MMHKSLSGLSNFLISFKAAFIVVLLNVQFIIFTSSSRVYEATDYHYNLPFWISVIAMFILFNVLTFVFFKSEFILINGVVTQFSIDDGIITLTTIPLKIPLLINRPAFELKLTMHQFARDKTIYPIRIFPFVKYPCWELRTDDQTTVYIISRFFTPESIEELEKFLYWKSLEAQV